MKYMILNQNGKKLQIPGAYLEKSRLSEAPKLEVHAFPHAMVLLPNKMEAMELILAIASLEIFVSQLRYHLAEECGCCEDCHGEECCPYEDVGMPPELDLPLEFREKLGIEDDAKLRIEIDAEKNCIMVYKADEDEESVLTHIPDWTLNTFREMNLCLGNLEKLILSGEIVYGE